MHQYRYVEPKLYIYIYIYTVKSAPEDGRVCRPKHVKHIPIGHRSAAILVRCPKAVYTVKSAPEDGRVCRPKHVEQIKIDQ